MTSLKNMETENEYNKYSLMKEEFFDQPIFHEVLK